MLLQEPVTQNVTFLSFVLVCPFINFFDTKSFVFHFPTFFLETKTFFCYLMFAFPFYVVFHRSIKNFMVSFC